MRISSKTQPALRARTSPVFVKHDDYMTPKYAWENIKQYIPKDKVIWEAFYGDGNSGNYLKELGFNVIHEEVDFYDNDLGDIIVSNPPFSQSKEVMTRFSCARIVSIFSTGRPSSNIHSDVIARTEVTVGFVCDVDSGNRKSWLIVTICPSVL